MTCHEALRELMEVAARFEKNAARHKRLEADRASLRDALTRAQLVLSVTDTKQPPAKATQSESYLRTRPSLKGLSGGKAKGSTRRGTVKRKGARRDE
jgi:hypothetical protein